MKDGGPAFPTKGEVENPVEGGFRPSPNKLRLLGGMSLRDYFAAQTAVAAAHAEHLPGRAKENRAAIAKLARNAYAIADAMLAEREKS